MIELSAHNCGGQGDLAEDTQEDGQDDTRNAENPHWQG